MKAYHIAVGTLIIIAGCMQPSSQPAVYDPTHFNGWDGQWQSDRPLYQGKFLFYSYSTVIAITPVKNGHFNLNARDSLNGSTIFFDSLRSLNRRDSLGFPFLSEQWDSIGMRFMGSDPVFHTVLGWPVHDTVEALYDSTTPFRFIRLSK